MLIQLHSEPAPWKVFAHEEKGKYHFSVDHSLTNVVFLVKVIFTVFLFFSIWLKLTSNYSKTGLKRSLKKKTKIDFQGQLSLNAGQKYCRTLQGEHLQYFRPSLSYHLSLRSLFCLFLSGGLRQILL